MLALTPLLWALLPLTTASTLPTINTAALLPWHLTALSTSSPPGMPAVHPYSHLFFTIADPNTITLGTTHFGDAGFPPSAVNCSVWWMSFGDDPRDTGVENACDAMLPGVRGKWTFTVVEGRDPTRGVTTDVGLRIGLEEAVSLETGGAVSVRFEGEVVLSVGEEMAGTCGGSGVCSWGLKGELVPVLVQQRLVGVECVAACDVSE
ncbi:hypothetical protein B0J18DRAFT_470373 [Chaetomium sp. MPI-SDFR-AT-0129]|nr:hypothetical protein B0J18DRAFT_470373 [Chaetomium sp. MPI-SDFR-AT-0129]